MRRRARNRFRRRFAIQAEHPHHKTTLDNAQPAHHPTQPVGIVVPRCHVLRRFRVQIRENRVERLRVVVASSVELHSPTQRIPTRFATHDSTQALFAHAKHPIGPLPDGWIELRLPLQKPHAAELGEVIAVENCRSAPSSDDVAHHRFGLRQPFRIGNRNRGARMGHDWRHPHCYNARCPALGMCARRSGLQATAAGPICDTSAGPWRLPVSIEAGFKPIPGFQLRYVYFLDPTARERLTVPVLPFSEIDRLEAGMYRGKSRAEGVVGDTPAIHAGEGGSIPTSALSELSEKIG